MEGTVILLFVFFLASSSGLARCLGFKNGPVEMDVCCQNTPAALITAHSHHSAFEAHRTFCWRLTTAIQHCFCAAWATCGA